MDRTSPAAIETRAAELRRAGVPAYDAATQARREATRLRPGDRVCRASDPAGLRAPGVVTGTRPAENWQRELGGPARWILVCWDDAPDDVRAVDPAHLHRF